jgi:hypothetical protein
MSSERAALPRVGEVRFIEVPPRRLLMIDGSGAPESLEFADAMAALYAAAYGLRFRLRKTRGVEQSVGHLEGLWDSGVDPATHSLAEVLADRSAWTWTLLIEVPGVTTDADLEAVVADARRRRPLPALDRVRLETLEEGSVAETLHVGPYATEPATIERLHAAVHDAGLALRDRHHEIYLGDPRRSAPERLRTILRHPVTPGSPR